MVILAALLLAVAVGAWPPRDRGWRASGGVLALGAGAGVARADRFGAAGAGRSGAVGAGRSGAGGARRWRWKGGRPEVDDGEELLVLLDAIAPALAAGLPPAAALAHLTRSGPGRLGPGDPRPGRVDALLADLVAEARAGRPLAPVWTRHALGGPRGGWGTAGDRTATVHRGPRARRRVLSGSGASGWGMEVAFVARAWTLSEALGSPLAECATVAARAVRQQSARRQRLAIALAGPRATAAVLTALPLAGPAVGLLLGMSPRQLYATPVAVVSSLSGLALLLLGRWWCARLVAGIGRSRPTGRSASRSSPTGPPSGWVPP